MINKLSQVNTFIKKVVGKKSPQKRRQSDQYTAKKKHENSPQLDSDQEESNALNQDTTGSEQETYQLEEGSEHLKRKVEKIISQLNHSEYYDSKDLRFVLVEEGHFGVVHLLHQSKLVKVISFSSILRMENIKVGETHSVGNVLDIRC